MNLKDIVIVALDVVALLAIIVVTVFSLAYGHGLNQGSAVMLGYGLAGFLISSFACGFWLLVSRLNDRLAKLEELLEPPVIVNRVEARK